MAKLTTKQRKGVKTSSFAVPTKRAYPINDINHARNALARVSEFGTAEEQAKVRKAVHAKYPSLGDETHSHRLAIAKKVAAKPANYESDYAEMQSGKKSRF